MEEKKLLETIHNMVIDYPNDGELGKKIREIFIEQAIQEKNKRKKNGN
jgi:hypothetical protein